MTVIGVLISTLAVIGLAISSYFTAVSYRWIRPDARWIPPFCRMEEQTCASIVLTPQARVFGVPNSVLGQVFYLSLLTGAWLGLLDGPLRSAYLAGSALTVGLAVYLSYSLLYVIRVRCVLCFGSHGINLVSFALLALME